MVPIDSSIMKFITDNIPEILNKIILFGILFLLTPLIASAEAGKGITDEAIILAIIGIVILFVNQVYLTITSLKKIINPEKKSSILHYITIVSSVVIFAIYIPNKGYDSPFLFDVFIAVPFILGLISLSISIFYWIKKK